MLRMGFGLWYFVFGCFGCCCFWLVYVLGIWCFPITHGFLVGGFLCDLVTVFGAFGGCLVLCSLVGRLLVVGCCVVVALRVGFG